MNKNWSTTTFVAIGALAALYTVLSLPGAILASVTGISIFAAVGNLFVIGIMFPLNVLILKRFGAMTLWATIVGILFIPLPIAGPPGLFIKVFYMSFWGIFADIIYLIFSKFSDLVIAIAINITQLAVGYFLAIFFWQLLGQSELANELSKSPTIASVAAASVIGILLAVVAKRIFARVKATVAIQRIQNK